MMLAALSFAACSSESLDGDWDPMKWNKVDYQTVKDNGASYYEVPELSGKTFVFTCRNYKGFWIAELKVNFDGVDSHIYQPTEPRYDILDCEFVQAEVKGNVLMVTFPSYEGTIQPDRLYTRYFDLTVTAGDVFHTLHFRRTNRPDKYTLFTE